MGRPRGQHIAQQIPGDPDDRFGFPALVDDFCADLGVRGRARETIRVSRSHLAKFAAWLETQGVGHPADVTAGMIRDYQTFLHDYRKKDGSALTLTTQGACLGPICRLYEWGLANDRLPHNPTIGVVRPPREQRLPKAVLTTEEAERVLDQPDTSTTLGLRDRAILETFYSTGIRRGELGRLNIGDLDRGRRAVLVRQAKGRKDRIIPIGTRALNWVDRYCEQSRPRLHPADTDALFLSCENGQALGLHRLSGLVAGYVDQAHISKRGGCHLFRHTLATLMLDTGADIRHVQAMLGHVNLTSTQIYTHVSVTALRAVHAATFAGTAAAEPPQPERDPPTLP